MRKLYLLLIAIFISSFLTAQTSVVFHENFELPSLGDSMLSSSNPVGANPWAISTNLSNSGLRSDSSKVQDSKTTYLTTNSFSTLGYSKVSLKFAQICKLLIQDGGTLQYSINGGSNWLLITDDYYQGNGVMSVDRFNEYSYSTLWKSGDTLTMPTNSWWTNETFDLSALIANQADVKLRFCITDGGNVGGEGRYGWLLDDITVFAANNEIDAPKITFKTPIIQDSVSTTGPFMIKAFITDSSNITTANLIYSVNGGNNIIVAMTHTDSTYIGEIPSFTYNNTISYKIVAIDQYGNQSISNSYSFIIKKAPLIVEIGSGTTNGYYAPIYVSSATSTYLYTYNASIYTAGEINSSGYIKSIAWNKANAGAYSLGNASFKIYLKEVSNTSAPTTYSNYTTELTGATLVYSNLNQNITANTGWDTYSFNVDSFAYNGQADLMVFVEFYRPGNATGVINYYYTSTAGKAYSFAGPIVPPAYSYANYRPHIQFGITSPNFQYDAGVSEVSTPSGVLVTTTAVPIKVRVKNFGTEILTKATVHWTLDGVYQNSSLWTGNLAQDMVSPEFQVASTLLSLGAHVIKAWTELPNDSTDAYASNDTIYGSVYVCSQILSGDYTVGNSGSDFPTLDGALNGLTNCGINGPVVFKLKAGTYNQQLTIPVIPGSSYVNTVTFESESGNNADVTIAYAAVASTDNWVVRLSGANYVKIKNITIDAQGSTYGRGVELALTASHNTIEGCKIIMPSTTSSNYAGIYTASTIEQYNIFKNNEILNGYYGIYNYGTSTSVLEKGNVIEGNTITGFYYYGIYSYYQDSTTIISNTLENGTNAVSTVYSIQAGYNDNLVSLSKNKVYIHSSGTGTKYGIYVYYCDNTATQRGIIANNFVSQSESTGTVYGIANYYSTYQNYYYNSVNITAGGTTYGAFYSTGGSNIDMYNNNLSNTGGGYAYYISTVAAIVNSNYNNMYVTGTNLAYWGGAKTNLAALQAASNLDANSISVNPGYNSIADLHVNNPLLNNKGIALTEVTDDIDGNVRNATTPDIGADEFVLIANDGGITAMSSPVTVCSGSITDVIFKVKNFGTDTLKTATINWEVNGIAQPSATLTDTLANLETANVFCSTYTFMQGISYNIRAWVSNPNNVTDDNFVNDTLVIDNFYASLSGSYTIGAVAADYATINLAVSDLVQKGVCGPTVFNILPGTYNENVDIPEISGSSLTNTITFQSSTNDSTSALIIYASAGANDNYVIKLNGADNIIIKHLTLQNNGGSYSKVIELASSADNNKIINNVITSSVSTSTTAAGIYNGSGLDQFNIFRNNIITNGYYGIYIYGTGSTTLEKGNIIDRNTITGFYSSGIYSYYQDSVTITSNTIENGSNAGTAYGIYPQYNDNLLSISNNKVYVHGSGTNYGIYIYYCDNTAAQRGIIANNFISQSGSTGTVYGLASYYSTYQNYHYNSVNITASGSTYGAFYSTGGSNINLYNNSFSNTGGGYAYYIATTTAIVNSDYNNLYTNGTNLAYWSSAKTDLAALQSTNGKETNSVSTDPNYFSVSDLHTDNTLMYKKGTPIAEVPIDIDGDIRPALPCIGADEYIVLPNDARVKALYTLGKLPKVAGSPHFVKSIIENKGYSTIYNLSVNLNITGSNTYTTNYVIDSIQSGYTDTITFAGFIPSNLGANNVKVTVPADDLLSNNEMNYLQIVTDTIFGVADTSAPATLLGFNAGEGLFLSKYYINGSKLINSVNAYITNSNTFGQKLYGVILNSNGVILDTSYSKIITASDTNNWVKFDFANPLQTNIVNDYFYLGIAQLSGTTGGYYPMGCQAEKPTRNNTFYYTTDLAGGSLTETTQFGRFMIEANIGEPINKDAAMVEVLSPNTGCGLSSELVTITLQNRGIDTIYGGQNVLLAKYGLILNGNLINVVSQQITDTIYPTASKTITFNVPLNVIAPTVDSTYNLITWVELANDPFASNDSMYYNFVVRYTPLSPVVNSVSIPYATSTTLNATSPNPMFWYDDFNSTTSIGQGASYTTPVLFATDTFYVAANTSISNTATFGNGTVFNTATNYPNPYGRYYTGNKDQYLLLVSELNAQGFVAGPITELGFNVITPGVASASGVAPSGTYNKDYTIKVGTTSDNALTTTFVTGLTQVYTNPMYQEVAGWNMHQFSTPFVWDGVSNLVIEVCMDKYVSGSDYSNPHAIVSQDATPFVSAINYHIDAATLACPNATGTTYSQRPVIKLSGMVPGCMSPKALVEVTVANVPLVDAGITQIISPTGSIPSGVNTAVTAIVKNWATSDLTSVTIGWSIDGVVQTPANWSGNLSTGQTSAPYQIANIPFTGGLHTIKAWSYNPNNTADLFAINDTATTSFAACMNGNFTIGATGNFINFNEALLAINNAGICGNVIFDVQAGTYNEQLIIDEIPNLGPNATITFRSLSGNNTSVILTYNGSSSTNAVLKLNGADYINFENITILSSGASISRAVDISSGANYNKFTGNIIKTDLGTTSAYAPVYSTSTGKDNHNEFTNNVISGGYYGIYWYGSSTNMKSANKFIGNTVKDFYYYGMYLYYNDSVTVGSNIVNNSGVNTTSYGIYLYYNNNILRVVNNKIHLKATTTNYCLYVYYSDNNASQKGLIANNFISQESGSGSTYGIYNSSSSNQNYYNNSINITSGSTSSYGFYITSGSDLNVKNNNSYNAAGGYAYYVSTTTAVNSSDFNNFYSEGTNIAYWGAAKTNLTALTAASGKDSNSVSVYPNYFSVTDLHVINYNLDGKATPLTEVTDDIDGNVRNVSIPDIGADEFDLPPNDAGVIAVYQPVSPVSAGVQDVKVIIRNFGSSHLTSVSINWTANGIIKTPFAWTGNLSLGEVDTVIIGNHNFIAGATLLKTWTSSPNNMVDPIAMNDTSSIELTGCSGPLSGIYTIGGTTANYQTINHAIQSLKYCGVIGPVTFNINSGNYYEQLLLDSIPGVSSVNTITFKSANNDSSGVVINYAPSSSTANYVLKLNNTDYITFKNLSIVNNTQNNMGRVVELANSANHNEFSNNVIQSVISTSSTTAGIYSYNTNDNNNTFANNLITGGYYGIYLYGVGSAIGSKEIGNNITNNVIKDFYYYGLYLYYQDSVTAIGNLIVNAATSGTAYGMYSYYSDNNNYQKNKILLNNSGTTYGMSIYYNNSTSGNGLIANNFISQSVGAGTVYGVYNYYSKNVKYLYNSINVAQGGATNYSIYFSNGATNSLFNNSIVNTGGGYAIYAASTTSISSCDYNNLFTTGTKLGYWNSADTSLATWQTASGLDSNSISMNPDYLTNSDLHVYSIALNDKGTPLSIINDDIDGQPRNATTPDIGADEFSPLPSDIGVLGIISPSNSYSSVGSNAIVKCIIKNYGSNNATNFNISYKAGANNAVSMLYSGTLIANTVDTVTFVTPIIVMAGPFEIKAYTSLINDGNLSNDTSKISYFGVPVKSIPYSENFDGSAEEWFQTGGSMQWQKGVPTASVINSAHSSPNVWATVLNGNYINNCNDYLYTPIFNNSIFKADTMKFWFWIDAENNFDGGRIEYKNDQDNWNILGNLSTMDTNSVNWYNATSQAMWTGTGTGWQEAKYAVSKLTDLGPSVQFRFVFHSDDATINNGWAIDDFKLTLLPIANDAGVIAITDPTTSLLGDTVYPKVTIKNFGLNTLTLIPVKYSINGQLMASETLNTSLVPGATAVYTFNQYFKVITQPTYTIAAYTTVTGDYYVGADSTVKVINVSPAHKDVGIMSIISPTDTVSSGSLITVTIKIKNYGSTPVSSIPVSYKRGTQPAQNATWTGTALNYGDSAIFAFPVTFTVPLGSAFTFSAYTSLAGDAFDLNDKITKSIVITSMPASAGTITSAIAYGGDTICFPTGSTTPVIVTYTVPSISNATNYVWNYTGTNAFYTDTTAFNSVTLTFNPNATDGILTVYGYNTLGNGGTSPDFAIDVIQNCSVGIEDESMDNFWLSQNMPNPTNNNTIIEYNIPQQGDIIFNIVNMIGQNVYNFHETKESGKHSININVNSLPDGIYYYSLTFKGKRLVKKMVVNK